ncbi:2239_t:CDS:2, partial [Gigaspora rosea]
MHNDGTIQMQNGSASHLKKSNDHAKLTTIMNFLPYLPNIIVKLGENGVLIAQTLDELKNFASDFETKQANNKIDIVIPRRHGKGETRFRYFEPILLDSQKHVNSSGT